MAVEQTSETKTLDDLTQVPVKVSMSGDQHVEHYGTAPSAESSTPPEPTLSTFIPKPTETKPEIKEEDLHDPEGIQVENGTICKRKGCGYVFNSSDIDQNNECIFHSGTPIFHEGSKGWSCCNRRVLEFEEYVSSFYFPFFLFKKSINLRNNYDDVLV